MASSPRYGRVDWSPDYKSGTPYFTQEQLSRLLKAASDARDELAACEPSYGPVYSQVPVKVTDKLVELAKDLLDNCNLVEDQAYAGRMLAEYIVREFSTLTSCPFPDVNTVPGEQSSS